MDPLKRFYQRMPVWKQLYYKWRAVRGIPFRRKFFVGYDLDANTYWEFYVEGVRPGIRPRRIVQPYEPEALLYNYFDKVPIQWAQWLKFSRVTAPSIFEILKDKERVKNLKILADFKDSQQVMNNDIINEKINMNLNRELNKIDQNSKNAANLLKNSGYTISSNDNNTSTNTDKPEKSSVKPRR